MFSVNCADRIAINAKVDLTTGFIVEKYETHKELTFFFLQYHTHVTDIAF